MHWSLCLFLCQSHILIVVVKSCPTLCDPMDCSMPGFPVLHYLPEFTQTHVLWVRWYHPTISSFVVPFPPACNLSQHQGLFQWVGSSHQVAKVLKLQHQSFSECSGLISSGTDWFNLLAVQGTLKNLCQHHNSKASILRGSVFFMVQLLYPYMTTGKTMTLTVWTFVGKVMSVLYNMLPGFVIAFLPRSKHLLIPWLQSLSTVILEPKKKVFHCFYFFPFCWLWSDGTRCHDLRFLSVEPQASFFTLLFHIHQDTC